MTPVDDIFDDPRLAAHGGGTPARHLSLTFVFSDGEVLTSDSTLRFRERDEVHADLTTHGYVVDDVRDAPDRPGRELVFVARRPA